MHKNTPRFILILILSVACVGFFVLSKPAAAEGTGEFSLQVSPSPLVTTVKPGQSTTVELKVRNTGPRTENLKIVSRSFKVNPKTQQLIIDDTKEPEIASWIHFSAPMFTVQSNQTITEKVTLVVPKEAGFSYSFMLMINRTDDSQPKIDSGRILKGSVAVFTLINVDRPGAVRALKVTKFAPTENIYEYLPAQFSIEFTNTGNTIVQPSGNIFVQRESKDKDPIDVLAVNGNKGYILPGSVRTLNAEWNNGFPLFKTTTTDDGRIKKESSWDWSNLSNLRIGRYTAKLVAIYNDGQRDVPIEGEVTFWVIPWKILLGALVILALIVAGLWSLISKVTRLTKRIKQ